MIKTAQFFPACSFDLYLSPLALGALGCGGFVAAAVSLRAARQRRLVSEGGGLGHGATLDLACASEARVHEGPGRLGRLQVGHVGRLREARHGVLVGLGEQAAAGGEGTWLVYVGQVHLLSRLAREEVVGLLGARLTRIG